MGGKLLSDDIEHGTTGSNPLEWTQLPASTFGNIMEDLDLLPVETSTLEFGGRLDMVWEKAVPRFAGKVAKLSIVIQKKIADSRAHKTRLIGLFLTLLLGVPTFCKAVAWMYDLGWDGEQIIMQLAAKE